MSELKVGEVAKIAGCHIRTVDAYIKKGYLEDPPRDINNIRIFSSVQALKLRDILRVRRKYTG